MNPVLAALLLLLLAAALLVLPVLPAIDELWRKRDAKPLSVNPQYAGDIRHFANAFREHIATLQSQLDDCVARGTTGMANMLGGDQCLLLGLNEAAFFNRVESASESACSRVVAAGVALALPPDVTFLKEVYARGPLIAGERNTFRAILGEGSVRLGDGSRVMRWAHAAGVLEADPNCDLYGRVSSDRTLSLGTGCVFQRLNAPQIVTAPAGRVASHSMVAEQDSRLPLGRRLVDRDCEIQAGGVVTENLISRGRLRIGAGARILGSVKSNGDMVIEGDVDVAGSLISTSAMQIGPNCRIGGPVIAEHSLIIASGSQCGSAGLPTTVSAPLIELEAGSLFFGTVWARERGRVVERR